MDYNRLMDFDIPPVRQEFSEFDCIRYAISIGLGHDQLDPWHLSFVDESKNLNVMPSFCTVLGHPGFWLADPRTTVNAKKLVHGEQTITIEKPIPRSGAVIGKTRIVNIVDKGKDKGALLYLEKLLRDEVSGDLIATEKRTIMLRGDGGYEGPSGSIPEPPPEPSGEPMKSVTIQTRPEQALLYRLNGDPNPLHIDPVAARAAGFDKPILHGLCTFGIACQAMVKIFFEADINRLGTMSARFSAPVFPGDTILLEAWENGTFQAKALEQNKVVLQNGFLTSK